MLRNHNNVPENKMEKAKKATGPVQAGRKRKAAFSCLMAAMLLAVCLLAPLPHTAAGAEESQDGAKDREQYHFEVWCDAGRVPVATFNENRESLKGYLSTHYIPTVTVTDPEKELYLIDCDSYYFAYIYEDVSFFKASKDRFSTRAGGGKTAKNLKPGDYLMRIEVWAMVFDILYRYDCYLHVIVPGGGSGSWPIETPAPPAALDPVPDRFLDANGNWITPQPPEYRPAPTPEGW